MTDLDTWNTGGGTGYNDENKAPWQINESKHANADMDSDIACRNCGQEGHFSRQCPEPRKMTGECFNCGEVGHNKTECTKPRVLRGPCRICQEDGHHSAECPQKEPDVCKLCKQEGHKAKECTNNRVIDKSHIAVMNPEDAWKKLQQADESRELDDIKDALAIYTKAVDSSYVDLEKAFRNNDFNLHLIGLQREVGPTHTIMDLKGKPDREFVVGYYFSAKARRTKALEGWPSSPEENMERLANAGAIVDRGVPQCDNCKELGHISKHCTQEKQPIELPEVKCLNCNEVGHRVRDCPTERPDPTLCRNCKKPGHNAKECTEERNLDDVECRRCNQSHFSKDCPNSGGGRACHNCGEEGHMSKDCENPPKCGNCDEIGHNSRECPKPIDWSRVKCRNCGEMGHGPKRCKAPPKEDDGWGTGDNPHANANADGDAGGTSGGDGGWTNGGAADTSGDGNWHKEEDTADDGDGYNNNVAW